MPSLSFNHDKDARPVAIVKGGKHNGKILYLHENDNKVSNGRYDAGFDKIKYMNDPLLKQMKLTPQNRTLLFSRLEQALAKGLKPEQLVEPDAVKQLYSKVLDDVQSDTSIELQDEGVFQLFVTPNKDKRECYFIAGASGAGKSYIIRQLAESYAKLYPDREIVLISRLNHDETLDSMTIGKPKRINIQSLLDSPPDIEEFSKMLVIADDFDTLPKEQAAVVQQLIDDILTMGRHTVTSIAIASHNLTAYIKTRIILSESTHFIVYPAASSPHHLRYLLQNYVGLDPKQIADLKRWKSRWVCIVKNYPQLAIGQNKAKILHVDDD